MTIMEKITTFIDELDANDFRNYLIATFSIFFLLSGFIVYRYYSALSKEKRRMANINAKREEVRTILDEYELVKKQQSDVDALLEQDKDFKIKGYFNNVMEQHDITNNKTREPEDSREVLENGYTEITLNASFSNLSMQTIAELLDTLEKNERIYTKYVELSKPNSSSSISLVLQIATLEPKTEEPEIAE